LQGYSNLQVQIGGCLDNGDNSAIVIKKYPMLLILTFSMDLG
jgi:hypothetical protein